MSRNACFQGTRTGSLALLRDLHDLYLQTTKVNLCLTVLSQAARALKDKDLLSSCQNIQKQTERQLAFLTTRIKQAAPQTLVVAD